MAFLGMRGGAMAPQGRFGQQMGQGQGAMFGQNPQMGGTQGPRLGGYGQRMGGGGFPQMPGGVSPNRIQPRGMSEIWGGGGGMTPPWMRGPQRRGPWDMNQGPQRRPMQDNFPGPRIINENFPTRGGQDQGRKPMGGTPIQPRGYDGGKYDTWYNEQDKRRQQEQEQPQEPMQQPEIPRRYPMQGGGWGGGWQNIGPSGGFMGRLMQGGYQQPDMVNNGWGKMIPREQAEAFRRGGGVT